MGQVIQFKPRADKEKSRNRVEAMMKGQLEVYVCDSCGEEFEILFGIKPKSCPGCGREISWEDSE